MPDMTKAHFWLADKSGCGYYRGMLPFAQLRQLGYQVAASEGLDDRSFNGIVVGQRVCKVTSSVTWQRMANHRDNFLVYEVDDDLVNVDPSNENAYYFFTHPEVVDNLAANIKVADLVTVSTPTLAQLMGKFHDRVVVLPNYINEAVLSLPRPVATLNDEQGQPVDLNKYVTIGYTSSPTHAMDFRTVAPQLELLAERDPRVVYVWIGQRYELAVNQIHLGWFDIGPDYYRALNFDIGIAPLAQHPFNDSKSHVKALEYAAAGIPVVASDQPPYRDFVEHGKTGFLARNPHQFYKYLRQLVNDQALRVEMGYRAREQARRWTIQEHAHLWAEAYGLQLPVPGEEEK